MFFKLIALDIDGTLTNSDKVITPATLDMLMRYQKAGGKVVLASGRPTQGIIPHAKTLKLDEYGGCILSYNGGCAVDCKTDEVIFRSKLPNEYIPEICEIIKDYPVSIVTYEKDIIIVGQQINKYTELEARINGMKMKLVDSFADYVDFDVTKCLLQGEPEYILELEKILSEKYSGSLGIFKSEPFFLEIVPDGVDKAKAIDRLINLLGISTEECIACGDGFNDISMIEYAGLGIAMSNAAEPVKAAADYITFSNNEDGIAYVLSRLSGEASQYNNSNDRQTVCAEVH